VIGSLMPMFFLRPSRFFFPLIESPFFWVGSMELQKLPLELRLSSSAMHFYVGDPCLLCVGCSFDRFFGWGGKPPNGVLPRPGARFVRYAALEAVPSLSELFLCKASRAWLFIPFSMASALGLSSARFSRMSPLDL